MKKKEYCEAEIDIISFAFSDIITTSNPEDDYIEDEGEMDKGGWA